QLPVCITHAPLLQRAVSPLSSSFFFNATATTAIYTLSLHDALPIFDEPGRRAERLRRRGRRGLLRAAAAGAQQQRKHERCEHRSDRKSTRLNSSHDQISYAVFCLKKKKRRSRTAVTLARRMQV